MKSCSRKILELFYNANHSGRIVKPDAIGRVGENGEGLVIELSWRVVNDEIKDAKFRAFGNPNAIAITSLVTDKLIGKTVSEALDLGESVLLNELEELRPEYIEAFDVVKLAIENTYTNYLKRQDKKAAATDETPYEQADESIAEVEVEPVVSAEPTELQLQQYIENSVFASAPSKVGRGRPRKAAEETTIETGEKRGRGRPKKIVDESQVTDAGEKRGRGRPRKAIDESVVVESEKRGRGRPKKVIDESEIVEPSEKRGRGRPRKAVDTTEEVIAGEKRSRGRPRKPVDETATVEQGEKRGRGRPKKVVDESEIVEQSEKRGRGRPKKIVDESQVIDNGEKRSRGRPRKTTVIRQVNISANITNESRNRIKIETLDNNAPQISANDEKEKFVEKLINNNVLVDDEDFDNDYDLFKSNIRSIFSGQAREVEQPRTEVTSQDEPSAEQEIATDSEMQNDIVEQEIDLNIEDKQDDFDAAAFEDAEDGNDSDLEPAIDGNSNVELTVDGAAEVKRGRGRPKKVVDDGEIEEQGEKRGRGRPRKAIDESVADEGEKRGRGRPKKIVDESQVIDDGEKRGRGRPRKAVEETTIEVGEKRGRGRPRVNSLTRSLISSNGVSRLNNNQDIVFASKNVTVTNINNSAKIDDEPVEEAPVTKYMVEQPKPEFKADDFDNVVDGEFDSDENNEIDVSNIRDEAPTGGIADLLKALLDE